MVHVASQCTRRGPELVQSEFDRRLRLELRRTDMFNANVSHLSRSGNASSPLLSVHVLNDPRQESGREKDLLESMTREVMLGRGMLRSNMNRECEG